MLDSSPPRRPTMHPKSTSSYRALPTPRPLLSHPALKHAASSTPSTAHTGALSALSTILLGQSAQKISNKSQASASSSSLLSRRRGKHELVLDADEIMNERPSQREKGKARATAGEQEEDLDDIPLLGESEMSGNRARRMRSRTASEQDVREVDLPPSPVGLPGGWTWETGDIPQRDRALLLPPPFLDEGSSRDSFAGVLGTRTAHLASQRAKREARMYARDRPPPPKFPASLAVTFNKLVNVLGPPSGLDSGRTSEGVDRHSKRLIRDRLQIERSERSLRGFEFGKKVAERVKERLRNEEVKNGKIHVVRPSTVLNIGGDRDEVVSVVERGATPMSFLSPSIHPLATNLLTPLTSPPLSSLFSPPVTSESTLDTPNDYLDEITPPRPKLGPILDEVEPSPFPLTPLDRPASSAATANDEESYFSIRRRNSRRNGRGRTGSFSKILHAVEEHNGQPAADLHGRVYPTLSTIRNPSSLARLGEPLGSALTWLDSRVRSHLVLVSWVLVGEYSDGDSISGILGVLLHLVGFLFFLSVHVWSLLLSAYANLITTYFFFRWIYMNLSGKTELAIVVKEYFVLCKHQWTIDKTLEPMSIWSVLLAFIELALIQSMTRERWLVDGPGKLRLLNGEDAEGVLASPLHKARKTNRRESAERPGIGRRRTTMAWTEDDGDGESLLVTGGDDSILEGTIMNSANTPRFRPDLDDVEDDDELPPLDIGDALPGFSFVPAPATNLGDPHQFTSSPPPLTPVERSPALLPVPDHQQQQDPLIKLLKNIKRHVRLATASYGLHSYILAPPTPLFTPSGTTLPHGVFAHLGGVAHSDVLHVAIQKSYDGLPAIKGTDDAEDDSYTPQFYLLRDDLNSEVVCVVRGTQSLADIVVDIQANMADLELPSIDDDGSFSNFSVHAGFLEAARRLLDTKYSPLWGKLKTSLDEHPGYGLVLTGHSLGAAIASTLAVLIGQYTSPSPGSSQGSWTTSASSGLPAGRKCQAICFAHPTTVDIPLSERCALGAEPLVLSVSLGSDLVVRMGLPQVREIRAALGRIANRRRKLFKRRQAGEHGITGVFKTWWRWKRIGGGMGEKSAEVAEIERRAWVWREEMDGLPERGGMMLPAGKSYHLDRLPTKLESKRKEELRLAMIEDDMDGDEPVVFGLYEVGDPTAFYACPHLEPDLITSHLPRCYLDAIEGL